MYDASPALRAKRAFPVPHAAVQIARVNEIQSFSAADLGGAQSRPGAGAIPIGHLVVGMKGGDVPRNVGRDAFYEPRELPDLIGIVIEIRNEQRCRFRWLPVGGLFKCGAPWWPSELYRGPWARDFFAVIYCRAA